MDVEIFVPIINGLGARCYYIIKFISASFVARKFNKTQNWQYNTRPLILKPKESVLKHIYFKKCTVKRLFKT